VAYSWGPRAATCTSSIAPGMPKSIEGRHLHYAGYVTGALAYHNLGFEVVTDERGMPTDTIKLTGGPDHVSFYVVVPEPPADWPPWDMINTWSQV
jgi:hypothetical protein